MSFINPEEDLQIELHNDIVDKVIQKTEKIAKEANFFKMHDHLLNKAEKKNSSPIK